MDRQTVIQNILTTYGKYGVTKEDIESLINESLKEGRSYDSIYFFLQLAITDIYGLKFFGVQRVKWREHLEYRMKECWKS